MKSSCGGDPSYLPPRKELAGEFHRFVAALNRVNGGLLWWAGPLASKNPFDSSLYESLARYTALVVQLAKRTGGSSRPRIAGGDPFLSGDLRTACRELGLDCGFERGDRLEGLRQDLRGIIYSVYFIFINIYKKILIRACLGRSLDRVLGGPTPVYLIRSWIDHRSFDPQGKYTDAYFGNLPVYLADSQRVVVVAGIVWTYPYLVALKKIRAQYPGVTLVPQEYFFTVPDIIRAALLPFSGGRGLSGEALFFGHDVKKTVLRAIRADRASLQIRHNLAVYYITRRLAEKLTVTRFTYSFENHAFEKMMILALRERSPETRITGYQHGGISRMLLSYFLAEGEAASVPLPDGILTTGEEPRRVLAGEGHYPESVVEAGCALRYEYLQGLAVRSRGKGGSLFVPLPVDIEAARAVLDIVIRTVGDRPDYTVKIKNHPLVPRQAVLGDEEGRDLPPNISWDLGQSTRDLLLGSDTVLYTQTTTCLEALMLGIPVVYLDIFTMYDADFILKDIPFRWVAGDPDSLGRVLSEIRGLGDEEFTARQGQGVAYARSFFAPVDEASLEKFR
ncbi:MAG TPA: hypothetical protein VLU98_01200 [Methanomicrobiales archaeon]|nr:hypothetical protein [Methanomicrobiales archaeon]